jgi:hypothetical protein
MTSPLTGDYDVCLELTESTLSAFVNARFEGKERTLAVDRLIGSGIVGQFVTEMRGGAAEVQPSGSGLTLTLQFADAGLELTLPRQLRIAPLSGTVTFPASVRMVTDPDGLREVHLTFDGPRPAVSVQLDEPGLTQAKTQLASLGVSDPVGLLTDMFRSLIADEPFLLLPLSTRSVSDAHANGSLQPLTLVEAQLRLLPAASSRPGVVCVLGTVLRSHRGHGNLAAKTLAASSAAHQGSVTLSSEAFHELVHCPALGSRFSVPVTQLCKDCGQGDSVRSGDLSIKEIDFQLQEHRISLKGKASTGGTGWSADISFAFVERLSVLPSGDLHADLALDGQPSVDVSLDWWVSLLSVITLGAIDAEWVEPAIEKLVDTIVSAAITNEIGNGLKRAFSGLNVSLDNATMRPATVDVHASGVVVQGSIALPTPHPPPATLELTQSVASEADMAVASGTAADVTCAKDANGKPRSYPYTDYTVHRTVAITPLAHRVGLPVTYTWSIAGSRIGAQPSTLAVSMPVRDNFGRQTGQRIVHVDIALSSDGSTLRVSNYPSEGYVAVEVDCQAAGPSGAIARNSTVVAIEGRQRRYGGDYNADSMACIQGLLADAKKAAQQQGANIGRLFTVGGDPLGSRGLLNDGYSLGSLLGITAQLGLQAGWLERSLSDAERAGGLSGAAR